MSAEFALRTARLKDPGLLGVYQEVHPKRRYYAMVRTEAGTQAKHYFPASVTQIAGKKWGEPVDFQSAAMAVSSDVHRAINAELDGLPHAYRIGTQEAQNSWDQFRDWRRQEEPHRILASEAFVWCRHLNVAGTLDLLHETDRRIVTDFKALLEPKATDGTGIPAAWKLQLAGYSLLLESCGLDPIDEGRILVLPKDGSPWQQITIWSTREARQILQFCFATATRMFHNLALARTVKPEFKVPDSPELSEEELWANWA